MTLKEIVKKCERSYMLFYKTGSSLNRAFFIHKYVQVHNIKKSRYLGFLMLQKLIFLLTMPILMINYVVITLSCNTISESTILFQFCFIQLCICTPFVISNKKKILDMHQTMTAPRIIIRHFHLLKIQIQICIYY